MVKQSEFPTWDEFVEEGRLEPYRLPVSKDEELVFEAPSGVAMLRIAQGLRTGDLELILHSLTGEHYDRVMELMGQPGASHKILPSLVERMMAHFDLYEEVTLIGPGGGKVKRKKPREIKAMIEQGYRPVGEVPASTA